MQRRDAAHRPARLRAAVRAASRPGADAAAARRSSQRSRLRAPRRGPSSPASSPIGQDAIVDHPARRRPQGRAGLRIVFGGRAPKGSRADAASIASRRVKAGEARSIGSRSTPPLITALVTAGREKRRDVPLAGDPEADDAGGPRDRGSPLLRSSGHRPDRHGRRASSATSSAARPTSRRQHDHAAAGQEHVPDAGQDASAAS